MSILFPKRKKKISHISNAFSEEEKAITPINVLKTRIKSWKTSISLSNFYVGDSS